MCKGWIGCARMDANGKVSCAVILVWRDWRFGIPRRRYFTHSILKTCSCDFAMECTRIVAAVIYLCAVDTMGPHPSALYRFCLEAFVSGVCGNYSCAARLLSKLGNGYAGGRTSCCRAPVGAMVFVCCPRQEVQRICMGWEESWEKR